MFVVIAGQSVVVIVRRADSIILEKLEKINAKMLESFHDMAASVCALAVACHPRATLATSKQANNRAPGRSIQ